MAQKITPCLWFDGNAEAAANFYVSVFKNSEVVSVSRSGNDSLGPADAALTVSFQLDGQEFTALNGGPEFRFTEAVSFQIACETQDEIDYYWDALSAGGQPGPCGWLKDQFGLSWQVVPTVLGELLQDENSAKASRVMQALLKMGKLDIAKLQAAYNGA